MLHVPIGNAKNTEMHNFHHHAPEIKYVQDENNNFCLCGMDSALFAANKHVAENAIVSRLSSSLSCDTVGFKNRIKFDSDILTYNVINNGEQQFRYNISQWKIKGSFYIFNDINDHITLVQLRNTAGNSNQTVSITGYRVYDSNYKIELTLMIEYLDIIFPPSKDKKYVF